MEGRTYRKGDKDVAILEDGAAKRFTSAELI
jgi:hypothetical protein